MPNTLDWRYALDAVNGVSHHLSNASRTLQSRFSNVRFSLLQICGKDYNILPRFILLTVWKITTEDESNEFPLTPHYLVGIGNSQPASIVFSSMVFAGFRTIPAMDVVKIKQINFFKIIFITNILLCFFFRCNKIDDHIFNNL